MIRTPRFACAAFLSDFSNPAVGVRLAVLSVGLLGALTPPCSLAETVPQTLAASSAPHLEHRTLRAARLAGAPPTIDGVLDEPSWTTAPVATDFVESRPRPGALATLVSRARVLVDGDALYVGLEYDDPAPGTIQAPLARRDDETTSDWAFVEIDSRHDRRSGFSFGVNPRGVQVDGLWIADTDYDSAWNSVWSAAATTGKRGWTAEFRIPFANLAFALPQGSTELVWGVNFYRYTPGHKASSNWSPRYQGLGGVVSRFNDLVVPAPTHVNRLEATPFAAARGGDVAAADDAVAGGADFSAGLGSSFRLTGTLLPDFGQVEADPSQVNLTAFELFQDERRPFFLEGVGLFRFDTRLAFSSREASFGNEAPFYSRRVGAAPRGGVPDGAEVIARPAETSLLGAAKLVGDTASGWTLGAFAAVSDDEQAILRRPDGRREAWAIGPRSTLGVARAVRSSRNGRTSYGFFATRFDRQGLAPHLADELVRSTSTLGLDLRHRFGGEAYETRAWLLGSRLDGSPKALGAVQTSARHLFQRPDSAVGFDANARSLSGLAGEASVARINGGFRWSVTGRGVTPGFDVDDTGYQQTSDWLLLFATWRAERFPDSGKLRTWAVGSDGLGVGWTTAGERRAGLLSAYLYGETRQTSYAKLTLTREIESASVTWLRGGPALLLPPRDAVSMTLASAQNRPTFGTLDASVAREPGSDSWSAAVSPFLNVRSSDRLQWSIGPTLRVDTLGWQPVARPQIPAASGGTTGDLVARVAQRTVSLTLRADYIFSPRLSLQFYAQPFATVGRYDRYQLLRSPRAARAEERFAPLCPTCAVADPASGTLALDLDGDGAFETQIALPDGTQRALNASAVMRWEFRPGSFFTLVWNQQRAAAGSDVSRSPLGALGELRTDAGTNVVLAKFSWRFGA